MKRALVATLDDSYIPGFLLTINSILAVSKNLNIELIVFEWNSLSEFNKKLIVSLYPNTKFRTIDFESYKNNATHDKTFRVWNYNCNYRFDIFELEEYDLSLIHI